MVLFRGPSRRLLEKNKASPDPRSLCSQRAKRHLLQALVCCSSRCSSSGLSNYIPACGYFSAGHSRLGTTLSLSTVCCILRCSSSGPSNPYQADGNFSARNAHLGITSPSPSENCACFSGIYSPSRCFPVMSSGSPASGISDRSSSDPSAGASREFPLGPVIPRWLRFSARER